MTGENKLHTLYRRLEDKGGSAWAAEMMLLAQEAINEAIDRFDDELQHPFLAMLDTHMGRLKDLEAVLDAGLTRLDRSREGR